MAKLLIAVAAGVVCVALGAVVVAVVLTAGSNSADEAAEVDAPGEAKPSAAVSDSAEEPKASPVVRRRASQGPRKPELAPPPDEEEPDIVTEPREPDLPEEPSTPVEKPALQGDMSREDVQARMEKVRKETIYGLRSAYTLKRLERADDEDLQLTPYQKEEVDLVRERMRLKAEAALGDLLEEEMELQEKLREIYRERSAIQQGLDAEFRDQLQAVLTPEQYEVIEGRRKVKAKEQIRIDAP